MLATYRSPRPAGIISVYAHRELPGVEVPDSRDNGLRCLRGGNEELGARRGGDAKDDREVMRKFVEGGKEEGV